MPLLLQGTAVVCAQTFVPREILQLIERQRVAVFSTVPAILRALAQLPSVRKPATLRLVISAGAPLSAEVARQFHDRYGIKIHNFYGASETGGICYDRTGQATLAAAASANRCKAYVREYAGMVASLRAGTYEKTFYFPGGHVHVRQMYTSLLR